MELLTTNEAARLLRVSRSQAYRLMNLGVLPYVKLMKLRRIRKEDLEKVIRDHLVADAKSNGSLRHRKVG